MKVIYDAAHAFGITYKGKGIGSFGDVSCFSFHATKVFNTIEGGAVCFEDDDFGKRFYGLKNFGIRGPETVDSVGANAKMNEFCAAMGLCNLRHIYEEIAKRKRAYECYRALFEHVSGIQMNPVQKDVMPNYSYFPIIVDKDMFGCDRDEIYERLGRNGIVARKYFYPITNMFECYKETYEEYPTPIALDISKRVLTLPLYADISDDEINRICDIILEKNSGKGK